MTKCREDPEKLLGQPLGMYHCPACGCMQVAGLEHVCDPDACLLEDCDCLPAGVHRSANLEAWLRRSEQSRQRAAADQPADDDVEAPDGDEHDGQDQHQ